MNVDMSQEKRTKLLQHVVLVSAKYSTSRVMVSRATKITACHSRYFDEYMKHNLGCLGQTLTFPHSLTLNFQNLTRLRQWKFPVRYKNDRASCSAALGSAFHRLLKLQRRKGSRKHVIHAMRGCLAFPEADNAYDHIWMTHFLALTISPKNDKREGDSVLLRITSRHKSHLSARFQS
jgi:hypothetical protein